MKDGEENKHGEEDGGGGGGVAEVPLAVALLWQQTDFNITFKCWLKPRNG